MRTLFMIGRLCGRIKKDVCRTAHLSEWKNLLFLHFREWLYASAPAQMNFRSVRRECTELAILHQVQKEHGRYQANSTSTTCLYNQYAFQCKRILTWILKFELWSCDQSLYELLIYLYIIGRVIPATKLRYGTNAVIDTHCYNSILLKRIYHHTCMGFIKCPCVFWRTFVSFDFQNT
jgi:hypothetical protein